MRKFNAIIAAAVLILFFIHAVIGGFQLIGAVGGGITAVDIMTRAMVVLIVIHIALSIKLTVSTLKAQKKAGVHYFKENKLFWARRISGFAVFVFILFHVTLFLGKNGEYFRLNDFGEVQLAGQILFVISLAVHIISNAKPMLISFGIKSFRDRAGDILFIVSAFLIFAGIAFFIYFARWNAL